MKLIGTIYATAEQLSKADAFADRQRAKIDHETTEKLSACQHRIVGGESRWYESPTIYATNKSGKVRWFETRKDGDYSIRK